MRLSRLFALMLCLWGIFVTSPVALASSDFGCSVLLKVYQSIFTGCSSVGVLSPGNDTRINLAYLMADKQKQRLETFPVDPNRYYAPEGIGPTNWRSFAADLTPPETVTPDIFAWGEGSICVSDTSGRDAFVQAVSAANMSDAEKGALQASRQALACEPNANATSPVITLPEVQSPAALAFRDYLAAVQQFYRGQFGDGSLFIALTESPEPWVREASRYMQARVSLLTAQATAFNEYGVLDQSRVDRATLERAYSSFEAYLRDYPSGVYASSASGLQRRVHWLANDKAQQASSYSELADMHRIDPAGLSAISELDLKLPADAYVLEQSSAALLAVHLLREMRDKRDVAAMTRETLEAYKARFEKEPELFTYLLAVHAWFVDKDGSAVLRLLPDTPVASGMSYLTFSQQLLRATALDATDAADARDAYVKLFPFARSAYQRSTLELALAMHDERHGNVAAAFDSTSLISDPLIRRTLLDHVAGPIILRQQAMSQTASQAERDTALFRLLTRDLFHGRYKGFLEDIKLLPPKPEDPDAGDIFGPFRDGEVDEAYSCPPLVETVTQLNINRRDTKGLLCLGDFFRVHDLYAVDALPADELGGTGTIFAGKLQARHHFYTAIMTSRSASREDRAYALYRAIHCYQPTGANGCGGEDVSRETRLSWFNELRRKYRDTRWGREIKYYW
jgi:hypothetical protein